MVSVVIELLLNKYLPLQVLNVDLPQVQTFSFRMNFQTPRSWLLSWLSLQVEYYSTTKSLGCSTYHQWENFMTILVESVRLRLWFRTFFSVLNCLRLIGSRPQAFTTISISTRRSEVSPTSSSLLNVEVSYVRSRCRMVYYSEELVKCINAHICTSEVISNAKDRLIIMALFVALILIIQYIQ